MTIERSFREPVNATLQYKMLRAYFIDDLPSKEANASARRQAVSGSSATTSVATCVLLARGSSHSQYREGPSKTARVPDKVIARQQCRAVRPNRAGHGCVPGAPARRDLPARCRAASLRNRGARGAERTGGRKPFLHLSGADTGRSALTTWLSKDRKLLGGAAGQVFPAHSFACLVYKAGARVPGLMVAYVSLLATPGDEPDLRRAVNACEEALLSRGGTLEGWTALGAKWG